MKTLNADMSLNQKDLRIKKLWEKGVHSVSDIARKIGYGGAMPEGIQRVEEGLKRLGIKKDYEKEKNKCLNEYDR